MSVPSPPYDDFASPYVGPIAVGGNGAFNAAGVFHSGGFSVGAVVGDFNADRKLDVIVASSGVTANAGQGSGVTVWLGNVSRSCHFCQLALQANFTKLS